MGLISLNGVETLIIHRGKELNSLDELNELEFSKIVVLFHGYGANAWDLSVLSKFHDQIDKIKSEKILWFYPQGLISLSTGFYEGGQRAWFPISVDRLLRQKVGDPDVLSREKIEEADHLLRTLEKFFDAIKKFKNVPLVLGGFSQGGMVSYHLLPSLVNQWKIKSLCLFSTLSIEFNRFDPLWRSKVQDKLPFLLFSHGKSDEILPYQEGRNLFAYLSSYFLDAEFMSFHEGHTIPPQVLETFFKHL